jgi:hypothetical protein
VARNAGPSRITLRSVVCHRNHTSCTMSSASAALARMRYAMPNRRGRTLTNAERASSSKAASSEHSGCMSIYTSEITEGVAVAWGIQTLRSLPPFVFRSAIAVSGGAFGHNVHKVTPQIRLDCGSVCRGAASVSATSYCIFVDCSCSVSNATIQASVSSKVKQQYLGVFDSSEL